MGWAASSFLNRADKHKFLRKLDWLHSRWLCFRHDWLGAFRRNTYCKRTVALVCRMWKKFLRYWWCFATRALSSRLKGNHKSQASCQGLRVGNSCRSILISISDLPAPLAARILTSLFTIQDWFHEYWALLRWVHSKSAILDIWDWWFASWLSFSMEI